MKPIEFFMAPDCIQHKQYEALRAFFVEGLTAEVVSKKFGYTCTAFYSLVRDFKQRCANNSQQPFFALRKRGRKPCDPTGETEKMILSLRKKYLSVPDIKSILDVQESTVSERHIYNVIHKDGFARLPRRTQALKRDACALVKIEAPQSCKLEFQPETFSSQNSLGAFCLLHYIQKYNIDRVIRESSYPETKIIDRLSSILSFVALKLSNVRRYTADDAWCMDRGLGLFAGLNVLPKAAWLSSYSHRVTREMNLTFLKSLHKIFQKAGFLSDTMNLDFTTIPYWGDASHLENNWSGTRHKALPAILAVLAQEPDSGIITYTDTNVRHRNKSEVVLEFLDFYRSGSGKNDLKYLVFDSKFTTYENLVRLDPEVKFLTIRRRGKKIVDELRALPASTWNEVRVPSGDGKTRVLNVNDTKIYLPDYGKEIRQIAITGHGKIKPALVITNDFEKPSAELLRKYARRWLVEKTISEQIEFFHLNKVSSSMVIKVDFDLTMSVLAHNLLRLFAQDLPGYTHIADMTLYNKFIQNSGTVQISSNDVTIRLKKKRNLPAVLTAMEPYQKQKISGLGNKHLTITSETTS